MCTVRWPETTWGQAGFPYPQPEQLHQWTQGIARVLNDQEGRRYFRQFLEDPVRRFTNLVQILELWVMCRDHAENG
jgi:hypothetical protein